MSHYLKHTNNTYTYRRRVPKELVSYIGKKELRIKLTNEEALVKATEYDILFTNCIKLIEIGGKSLVESKLSIFRPHQKEVKEESKPLLSSVISKYLDSLTCATIEQRDRAYFLKTVLPCFNLPSELNKITYSDIKNLQSRLVNLPKRNIQKYRDTPIDKVIKLDIPAHEKISTTTVNKYIKWVKSVLTFAVRDGLINYNPSESLKALPNTNARIQREHVTQANYELLKATLSDDLKLIADVLYFSGMRLSELYKFSLSKIDDVLCFDLTSSELKLKTHSSYRLIPVHSKIDIQNLCLNYTSDYLSKKFKKALLSLPIKSNKISLYSLRHSFATELIQKGADSNIVSELMGHAHSSMTLSRYAKGFSINQLKETIELL